MTFLNIKDTRNCLRNGMIHRGASDHRLLLWPLLDVLFPLFNAEICSFFLTEQSMGNSRRTNLKGKTSHVCFFFPPVRRSGLIGSAGLRIKWPGLYWLLTRHEVKICADIDQVVFYMFMRRGP